MKCNEIKAKKLKQKSNKFCNGCGMAMVLVELILNQCKLQRKFFAHYSQMPNDRSLANDQRLYKSNIVNSFEKNVQIMEN